MKFNVPPTPQNRHFHRFSSILTPPRKIDIFTSFSTLQNSFKTFKYTSIEKIIEKFKKNHSFKEKIKEKRKKSFKRKKNSKKNSKTKKTSIQKFSSFIQVDSTKIHTFIENSYIHTEIYTIHIEIHTNTHKYTHIHTEYTQIHTYTHIYTQIHTYTHLYTHPQLHTPPPIVHPEYTP